LGTSRRGTGSLEHVGDSPRRVLIGFNSGVYEGIDLTEWVVGNPVDVPATNFGRPAGAFEQVPRRDVFIAPEDRGTGGGGSYDKRRTRPVTGPCFEGNFVGADYGIVEDLTGKLPESWRDFNAASIPVFLAENPHKTKIAAGLACGCLWTVGKGARSGDVVLCPDGAGRYRVGEVAGDYYYAPGDVLPHRRPVTWLPAVIDRADTSDGLRNTTGSTGTVCTVTRAGYAEEVEKLLGGAGAPALVAAAAARDRTPG
jgi:hypothetical protein